MTIDEAAGWHTAVRRALATALTSLVQVSWLDEGGELRGPANLAVRVAQRHPGGRRHVDIGFAVNREQSDALVVWDCVVAPQDDTEAAAEHVCRIWMESTAPVVLELVTQKGRFADHAHGADGLGIAGWHSIHGPILAYGAHGMDALQRWLAEHPPMPALQRHLQAQLTPDAPHTVMLHIVANGDGSTSEVRVDGEPHRAASAALQAMSWPRRDVLAVARQLTLFAHHADSST